MSKKPLNIPCYSAAFALVALAASAYDGSGSGKAITPYDKTFPATAENVQSLRDQASRNCSFADVRSVQAAASKSGVALGLAFVKDGLWDRIAYSLTGIDRANGSKMSVDLAEIENVVLVEGHGRGKAALNVSRFPAVSVAELLASQPSYSALRAKFAKEMQLEIDLVDSGADLALVGKDWFDDPREHVVCLVRDLRPGNVITVDAGRTRYKKNQVGPWWAIESVTNDKKYPHKMIMKR